MATNVSYNGVTYSIPADGDTGWGPDLTAYFISLATNSLQKSGGTFALTAELGFGSSFGIKSLYFKSQASNPAASGVLRLGSAQSVSWRNNANSADLALTTNSSDVLLFNSSSVLLAGLGSIVNADINAAAGIDSTKIATGLITNTEFEYLNGVTSAIQTQIDSKEPTFTTLPISKGGTNSGTALVNNRILQSSGGAIVEAPAIPSFWALASDANGIPTASATTALELSYVSGVTSAIQTQLNSKLGLGSVQTRTSAYTVLTTDSLILCSGAAFTVTLFTAVGNASRRVTIKKTDSTIANKITIAFNGAETADGSTTILLYAQYDEYTLISNGTNWSVESKIIKPVVFVGSVNSNFGVSSTTPLTITESKDTHDAWVTNTFTVPYSADYLLGFVTSITAGSDTLQIYKNGAGTYLGGYVDNAFRSFYVYMQDLAAGDTIQIRSSGGITIAANGNAKFSIRSVT